jgi:hypothetical protein
VASSSSVNPKIRWLSSAIVDSLNLPPGGQRSGSSSSADHSFWPN